MGKMVIVAGPKGLKIGDELSFYYPSTEWEMTQSFDCLCGTASCLGKISGAKYMLTVESLLPVLAGGRLPVWYNSYIVALFHEHHKVSKAFQGVGMTEPGQVGFQVSQLLAVLETVNPMFGLQFGVLDRK